MSAADPRARARRAFITGLGGTRLSEEEAGFLARTRPCGLIIFTRNYQDPGQLRQLIADATAAAGGGEWLVLVDQEGGRVQRLKGAGWPDLPPAATLGILHKSDPEAAVAAATVLSHWLSLLLREVGINTNCVPCLDVPVPGADGIIGDRAFARDVSTVTALGQAVAAGAMAGGVLPIMKHIPGHGRAGVDSHLALPVVEIGATDLEGQDFAPFKALNALPAAMTAHVTFSRIDPLAPASVSRQVTAKVIRGLIGFDGLLISDDVSMQALAGSIAERAAAVIAAGSDVVLHCNGRMAEMLGIAENVPFLDGIALARYERCLDIVRRERVPVDIAVAKAALERLRLAGAAS